MDHGVTGDQPALPLVEAAEQYARRLHQGQVDQQGRDYATGHLEPIAAALAPHGPVAVAAGWLHDIIEDCGVTTDTLRGLFPDEVVDAVESVTRRDGETYADLIDRACAHPVGVLVKLADNEHNLLSNPGLAVVDQAKAERLLRRYLTARDRLIVARERLHPAHR